MNIKINALFTYCHYLFLILFLASFGTSIHAQKKIRTHTLSYEKGQLVKKSVTIDFLNSKEQIAHKWIDSLTVYHLDSVAFVEEMPELYEIYGQPVHLDFTKQQDSLLLKQNSPEYFAVFAAYHTIKALRFYKSYFGHLVNFKDKDRFKHLKVFLGDFINCNPEEYVFNPDADISPTTIYHEVGHRAFCQLDDILPVGNINTLVHNGLLEYFTGSIADYPVVGEGFLPEFLLRDLSKPVQYPEDLYYYQDFMEDFQKSYKDTLSYSKSTKRLLELNEKRAENCTDTILMSHQSGLLIAHPLWETRKEIGAVIMDSLIVRAMHNLLTSIDLRNTYLDSQVEPETEKAQWYDLLYALYQADKELYNGQYFHEIKRQFSKTGYQTNHVKFSAPSNNQNSPGLLANKKILVTAPAHYAPRFADILRNTGAEPVILSAIETVFNPDPTPIDRILDNPKNYDWVVLPSRKAIEAFFRRSEYKNTPDKVLNSLRFLAIGKDIEYMKSKYNAGVSFVPEEPSPNGITQALSEMENIRGRSVAVIAPRVVGFKEPDAIPDFIKELKRMGMKPIKIEGYITRVSDSTAYSKELSLIRKNKLDLIAFTSTGEIEALIQMLGDVKWLNQNTVACFGPYTAANARKLGVKVDFTGREFHSFEDYVEGIARFLESK